MVEIRNNLSTIVDIPVTESQIGPLARLAVDQRLTAGQKAVEPAKNGAGHGGGDRSTWEVS